MGFTTAPKLDAPRPAGFGISCSLRVSKRAASFWLILNEEAQKRYFGRTIIGEKADVAVGRGADEGKLRLSLGEGEFEVAKGMRGSAVLKVGLWDLLPRDKRPAAGGIPITYDDNTLVVKLPSWAKPSGNEGKMHAEFGGGISARKAG